MDTIRQDKPLKKIRLHFAEAGEKESTGTDQREIKQSKSNSCFRVGSSTNLKKNGSYDKIIDRFNRLICQSAKVDEPTTQTSQGFIRGAGIFKDVKKTLLRKPNSRPTAPDLMQVLSPVRAQGNIFPQSKLSLVSFGN